MTGHFDNKRVYIDLEVSGAIPQGKQTIKVQVDTGYDGYLSLPFSTAFPLGLALIGTKAYTIADGSTSTNLVCLGNISINGKPETIPIDLIPSGGILIGMALLEKLCNDLQISFKNKTLVLK